VEKCFGAKTIGQKFERAIPSTFSMKNPSELMSLTDQRVLASPPLPSIVERCDIDATEPACYDADGQVVSKYQLLAYWILRKASRNSPVRVVPDVLPG